MNDEIAVGNDDNSITIRPRTASGNVAPIRTILGACPSPTNINGLVIDTVNDELVVGCRLASSSIVVFARKAGGAATPLRTIAGPSTGLGWIQGVAVDTLSDEILVTSDDRVLVFSRTAKGNIAPLRIIAGADTGLISNAAGIVVAR